MKRYKIFVDLSGTYEIEAESEEEAFEQASDAAMYGGEWFYEIQDEKDLDKGEDK